VLECKTDILKKFKLIKAIPTIEKLDDSLKLMQLLMMFRLLIPLERHPQYQDELKKKWPRHLMIARAPIFGPKGFYMFQLPKSHKKLAILLTIGIIVVIAFMLFSIWPLWLKIAIWYVSFYTLVFLVSNSMD
jgi:hypothetical protein